MGYVNTHIILLNRNILFVLPQAQVCKGAPVDTEFYFCIVYQRNSVFFKIPVISVS